jgi:hypothetical protein
MKEIYLTPSGEAAVVEGVGARISARGLIEAAFFCIWECVSEQINNVP